MILRFKTMSSDPEYIAINTIYETYTTNAAEVKRGELISIPANHYTQILKELNFCGWNYAEDLHRPAIIEDIPF